MTWLQSHYIVIIYETAESWTESKESSIQIFSFISLLAILSVERNLMVVFWMFESAIVLMPTYWCSEWQNQANDTILPDYLHKNHDRKSS